MKVVQRIPAQGTLREYLLSFGADSKDGPVLVLTKTDKVDPKTDDFGRIIFDVPNGEALARRAAEAGYPPRRIVTGSNTITDPEGHQIELFQSRQSRLFDPRQRWRNPTWIAGALTPPRSRRHLAGHHDQARSNRRDLKPTRSHRSGR